MSRLAAAHVAVRAAVLTAVLTVAAMLAWAQTSAHAAGQEGVPQNIHKYTLDNGLRVILVERHHAPVVHVNLMFGVGRVDEPPGLSGIAHMAEHMAAVGSGELSSFDLEAERLVLQELEDVVAALKEAERAAAAGEDRSAEIAELRARFAAVKAEAETLYQPYLVLSLLISNGAVGLQGSTASDMTYYVASLPKNRFELWARLVGDGLREPIMRHFYNEIEVVRTERFVRMQDPWIFLYERLLAEAFQVHPYGRDHREIFDFDNYTARAARAFWDAYYIPRRAVLAVAGDIDPEETLAIIRRYFGGLPSRPDPGDEIPAEPPQQSERRVTVTLDAEPRLVIGYRRPTYPHRDAYALDVIHRILMGTVLTTRHPSPMMTYEPMATVSGIPSFPGVRYPNLLMFQFMPVRPHGPEEVEQVFYEEIERLKTELVDPETLQIAKNRIRAAHIYSLESEPNLIHQLSLYELFLGGWEKLFEYPDIIDTITAEEGRDAARRDLTGENRTVAVLLPERGDAQ